jgi:hypothetical protein
MAAPASGANAKVAMKRETTYGVAASGNYVLVPAYSIELAPRQEFERQPLIGLGRQPVRPTRGIIEVTGTVELPIDLRAIGHWLTMLLGLPATSGSGPYTHVWSSTATALPSFTMEVQHVDLASPRYLRTVGVMANRAAFRFEPGGFPRLRLDLIGAAQSNETTSAAGTPTELAYTPFSNLQSLIKKDGSNWAKVLNSNINYNNNLDLMRYVGGGGVVEDIVPGAIEIDGDITLALADDSSLDLAEAATVFDLQIGWTGGASQSFTIELDQAELGRAGPPVNGGGRVEVTHEMVGSKDSSEGRALAITVVNDVTSYAV